MQIASLSLSHNAAEISIREKCSLNGPDLSEAVADLADSLKPVAQEAAVVSTCNRTEIYVAAENCDQATQGAFNWIGQRFGFNQDELKTHWAVCPDRRAVEHLFKVVSGLDSMVLGEPQILGQVKGAARVAQDAGALGSHLNKLFQHSFSVAKEVRTNTGVGHHSVSLGAAALRSAKRIFEDFNNCSVLFVGAGEMIELVATHFAAAKPREIVVANRTPAHAEALAKKIGGRVASLSVIDQDLAKFDVVVSCTGSPTALITHQSVHRALAARRQKPIVLVDLAVPRDIEETVGQFVSAYLFTIDDLGRIVQSAQDLRRAAVDQAQQIIDARTDAYMNWLAQRNSVPAIKELRSRAQALSEHETRRALRELRKGRDPEQVLASLSSAVSAKFIHGPMQMLRGSQDEREAAIQIIDRILPKTN